MIRWLAMGWRHVCFANWPVDPAVIDARLPEDLTVDTFDGQGWLSVVPFTNVDVRPRQLPGRLGFALPELNLRTYVTHDGEPGVYFFSLDAEGSLGVLGARLFHQLPYYYARIDLEERGDAVRFASTRLHPGARPATFRASYEPTGQQFLAESGSLERFLTRRDRYYTQGSDGRLLAAAVSHEPWPLYEATVDIDQNSLFTANGFETPTGPPLCLYSPRVETTTSANAPVE
jgi:hypothetical protein